MTRRIVGLASAIFMLAGIALSLGASAALAQVRAVTPDFTCADRSVCTFTNSNETGTPTTFATASHKDTWYTFKEFGLNPNPVSATNHSGSTVYFYAKDTGNWVCLYGNVDAKTNLNSAYGWFYIRYGNSQCAGLPAGHP
jgi:hypothetical protein